MPVFSCPSCRKSLSYSDKLNGNKVVCPKCLGHIQLPNEPEEPAPISPPHGKKTGRFDPGTLIGIACVVIGVLSFVVIPNLFSEPNVLLYALWIVVPIAFIAVPLGLLLRRAQFKQIESLLDQGNAAAAKELIAKAYPNKSDEFAIAMSPRYRKVLTDQRIAAAILDLLLNGENLGPETTVELTKKLHNVAIGPLYQALTQQDQARRRRAFNLLSILQWKPTDPAQSKVFESVKAEVKDWDEAEQRKQEEERKTRRTRQPMAGEPVFVMILKAGNLPTSEATYVSMVLEAIHVKSCANVKIECVTPDKLGDEMYLLGCVAGYGFDLRKASITPFTDLFGGRGVAAKVYA